MVYLWKTFNGDAREVTKPLENHRWQWWPEKIILPSHRWEKMIIVQVYAIQYNNIHYHSIPSIPYNSCKMTRQHHFGYNSRILNNWAGLIQFTICSSATSDAFLTNLHFFHILRQSGNTWITLDLHPNMDPATGEGVFKLTVKRLSP